MFQSILLFLHCCSLSNPCLCLLQGQLETDKGSAGDRQLKSEEESVNHRQLESDRGNAGDGQLEPNKESVGNGQLEWESERRSEGDQIDLESKKGKCQPRAAKVRQGMCRECTLGVGQAGKFWAWAAEVR